MDSLLCLIAKIIGSGRYQVMVNGYDHHGKSFSRRVIYGFPGDYTF